MRFSLRSLLLMATAVCLLLAVWAWLSALGLLVALALLGLACWASGLRGRSRWRVMAGASVLVVIALVLTFDLVASVSWIGRRAFVIDTTVVDVRTGQAISDAEVGLGLYGRPPSVFHAVDEEGRVQVWRPYSAVGTDSALRITRCTSGTIALQWHYLVVVDANGKTHQFDLAGLLGQKTWSIDKPLPPTVLKVNGDALDDGD